MASPVSSIYSSSSSLMEGYLCPICLVDLGDSNLLEIHFEKNHHYSPSGDIESATHTNSLYFSRNNTSPISYGETFEKNFKQLLSKAKKIVDINDDASENERSNDSTKSAELTLKADQKRPNFNYRDFESIKDDVLKLGLVDAESGMTVTEIDNPRGLNLSQQNYVLSKNQPKSNKNAFQTDYTSYFKNEREIHLERNESTSLIMIRLGKLMEGMPLDRVKRREHEQSIVSWIQPQQIFKKESNDDVNSPSVKVVKKISTVITTVISSPKPLNLLRTGNADKKAHLWETGKADSQSPFICPTCAQPFQVTRRRQHHCRLCGTVLCGPCSQFLPLDEARKIVDSQTHGFSNSNPFNDSSMIECDDSKRKSTTGKFIKEAFSGSPLLVDNSPLRLCVTCSAIVKSVNPDFEEKIMSPLVEELQGLMGRGHVAASEYRKMVRSIENGEMGVDVELDVKRFRIELLQIGDKLDQISRQIVSLSDTGEDRMIKWSSFEVQLQKCIRQVTLNFIKDHLVSLPSIPSRSQVEHFKELRLKRENARVEMEKKVLEEAKKVALENRQIIGSSISSSCSSQVENIPIDCQSSKVSVEDDCGRSNFKTVEEEEKNENRSNLTSNISSMKDEFTSILTDQIMRLQSYIDEASDVSSNDVDRNTDVEAVKQNLKELQYELSEYQRKMGNESS